LTFADSSFFIALVAERDRRHADGLSLLEAHSGERLITTNHVVGETWTFLRSRYSHAVAVLFLEQLDASARTEIVVLDARLEVEAWSWLRRRDERVYSFVDATSFALMRHRLISEAFAFGGDFTAAGFVELRP
jgi:uncharacterized protein